MPNGFSHFKRHVASELDAYFFTTNAALDQAGASPKRRLHRARALGAALLGAGVLVVAALASRARHDLALHRPTKASSVAFDTKASGAVDGFRYGQLGFHSKEEREPWLTIDLGDLENVAEVSAFGRADCCFDQSIPLWLELSSDGHSFERAAERTTPFSQFEPWTIELNPPVRARYVRLKTGKRGFLVLSEVEVYGR